MFASMMFASMRNDESLFGAFFVIVAILTVIGMVRDAVKRYERRHGRRVGPGSRTQYATPREFEEWCASELAAAGWEARHMGGPGDQGVDVIASRDGRVLVLQCKLHGKPVSNGAVQEVFAGRTFHGAHVAAVVSVSGFTRSAQEIAERTGVHLLEPEDVREFEAAVAVGS